MTKAAVFSRMKVMKGPHELWLRVYDPTLAQIKVSQVIMQLPYLESGPVIRL